MARRLLATATAALLLVACTAPAPDPAPTDVSPSPAAETPVTVAEVSARADASFGAKEPGLDVRSTEVVAADDGTLRSIGEGPGVVTRTSGGAVVGDGSPSSCTSSAVVTAVRGGGTVSFDCGDEALVIEMSSTAYVCNTDDCSHPWEGGTPVRALTVDGGGLITLSGRGERTVFYANTCEESFGWLDDQCSTQTTPQVTFRNIGFADGNGTSAPGGWDDLRGGGAIAMRGGTLTVSRVTFSGNTCMRQDSDGGGGAVRVTGMVAPVTISGSTFRGNSCANGGAVSALHASLDISDSTFSGNRATGQGASSGLGGNGGAVYSDGTTQNTTITGSRLTGNVAPEGGSGVFFVSNDRTGSLTIRDSTVTGNTGESFSTAPYGDLFFLGSSLTVSGSSVD